MKNYPFFSYEVPLIFSGGAFLESMYLVGIQAFVLRKFCEWCLGTAVINVLILIIVAIFFR